MKNEKNGIWDMIIEDMKQRNELGIRRYGVKLTSFNKRNSSQDLMEELLDAIAYLKQSMEERQVIVSFIKQIANADLSPYQADAKELLDKLGEIE